MRKANSLRALLASLGVASFYSVFASQPVIAVSPVRFKQLQGHLIITPVSINGAGPFDFIFDTGASATTIDCEIAKHLSLHAAEADSIRRRGMTKVVTCYRLDILTLRAKSIENLTAPCDELREVHSISPKIRDVLGQDFLSRFNYILTYRDQRIEFEENGCPSQPTEKEVTYEIAGAGTRSLASCAQAQAKHLGRIGYIKSNMNPQVIQEFVKAWRAAGLGRANTERAVLIFRKADGALVAEGQGSTNQFERLSVKWNQAAIAIVHTHRNQDDAEPSGPDKEVANKLGVPILTITNRGMYAYNPESKEVIKVQDGLDWLDPSKWSTDLSPVIAPQQQSVDRRANNSAGGTDNHREEAQESGNAATAQNKTNAIEFILGAIGDRTREEFQKAWRLADGGATPVEAVVLLYHGRNGSLIALSQGRTNQRLSFSFKWSPSIIGVVHTHPNGFSPAPAGNDLDIADKYRVPVFTITNRGMFVYDPASKKTWKVLDGLAWMQPPNGSRSLPAAVKE